MPYIIGGSALSAGAAAYTSTLTGGQIPSLGLKPAPFAASAFDDAVDDASGSYSGQQAAVAAGTVARATNAAVRNSFTNEPKRDVAKEAFNPKAMTTDAVVGGISGVATYYSTGGIFSSTSIDRRYGGSTTPTSTKPTQGDKPNGSTSGDNPLENAARDASGEYAGEQANGAAQSGNAGTGSCTAGQGVSISNDILGVPRVGSALKLDDYHAFSDIVDSYAGLATKTSVNNGTLYQLEGSLNGVQGRFEWILDDILGKFPGQVSLRMFIPNGTYVGGR